MQCGNCKFENMPGVETCGRCGSPMRVATMVVDIRPPRASRWRKAVRRALPTGRQAYRETVHGIEHASQRGSALAARAIDGIREQTREQSEVVSPSSLLIRLWVPGWPQFHSGLRLRGLLIFAAWIALMLCAVQFMRDSYGVMLLGSALSLHMSTAIQFVLSLYRLEPPSHRAFYAVMTAVGLIFLVFIPLVLVVFGMSDVERVRWTWGF